MDLNNRKIKNHPAPPSLLQKACGFSSFKYKNGTQFNHSQFNNSRDKVSVFDKKNSQFRTAYAVENIFKNKHFA